MSDQKPKAPPTFVDQKKRTWSISLNLELVDAVQAATQVDLVGGEGDSMPVIGLMFDRRKLGDALWVVCQEQAKAKDIDKKEFRSALDGDALTNGWGALADAVIFFTPTQSQSATRAAFDKQMQVLEKGAEVVARVARSQATDDEVKKHLERIEAELTEELPRALEIAATHSRE